MERGNEQLNISEAKMGVGEGNQSVSDRLPLNSPEGKRDRMRSTFKLARVCYYSQS